MVLGSTRFNDIERGLPGISRTLLAQRLRHLERKGVLERRPAASRPGQRVPPHAGRRGPRAGHHGPGRVGRALDARRARAATTSTRVTLTWWMHRRVDQRAPSRQAGGDRVRLPSPERDRRSGSCSTAASRRCASSIPASRAISSSAPTPSRWPASSTGSPPSGRRPMTARSSCRSPSARPGIRAVVPVEPVPARRPGRAGPEVAPGQSAVIRSRIRGPGSAGSGPRVQASARASRAAAKRVGSSARSSSTGSPARTGSPTLAWQMTPAVALTASSLRARPRRGARRRHRRPWRPAAGPRRRLRRDSTSCSAATGSGASGSPPWAAHDGPPAVHGPTVGQRRRPGRRRQPGQREHLPGQGQREPRRGRSGPPPASTSTDSSTSSGVARRPPQRAAPWRSAGPWSARRGPCPAPTMVRASSRARSGSGRKAPEPTFTSRTSASVPSAIFLDMIEQAISGMDSTVPVDVAQRVEPAVGRSQAGAGGADDPALSRAARAMNSSLPS